ncbi:SSI family serine proteinase inhibitor [Streptomyces sp. M19]
MAAGLGAGLAMSCLMSTVTAARAEPAPPRGRYAPSALVLSVGNGEHAASAAVRRAVTLSCAPSPAGAIRPPPRRVPNCARRAASSPG